MWKAGDDIRLHLKDETKEEATPKDIDSMVEQVEHLVKPYGFSIQGWLVEPKKIQLKPEHCDIGAKDETVYVSFKWNEKVKDWEISEIIRSSDVVPVDGLFPIVEKSPDDHVKPHKKRG